MAVKMMGEVKRKEDPRLITGAPATGRHLQGLPTWPSSTPAHARHPPDRWISRAKRQASSRYFGADQASPRARPVDQASTEGGEGQASVGRSTAPGDRSSPPR
jgi:hypothetical protein